MEWTKLVEVFVVVIFTSSGQLLLRFAMRNASADADFGQIISFAMRTPALWLGIGFYGISTLLWIRVLSRYPVGAVYPMVAIGYVLVTLGGMLFLNEQVSPRMWIALAVISAGTLLLASVSPVGNQP